MCDIFREERLEVFSARLIAIGHQHKARVISVCFQNAFRLRVHPIIHRLAVAERRALVRP